MAKHISGLTVVDHDTGEEQFIASDSPTHLIDALLGYAEQIRREAKGLGSKKEAAFVMATQEKLDTSVNDMSFHACKVFMKMLANTEYGGKINISQKSISVSCGIHKSDVSKAVKELIENGLIFSGEKVAGRPVYFLSKAAGRKGRSSLKNKSDKRTPEEGKAEYVTATGNSLSVVN